MPDATSNPQTPLYKRKLRDVAEAQRDAASFKCDCGHAKGRHQLTNFGHYAHCADCGCERF